MGIGDTGFMLTTRSFRNEDPPALLSLWQKSQRRSINAGLVSLSMNTLQTQILGVPFCDRNSIILTFDNDEFGKKPVGYVHTCLGPKTDASDIDPQTGEICFIAVNPEYPDSRAAARILLEKGEKYLRGLNVKRIVAASLRPCAPFYIGFYGDSEPVAFFDSEPHIISAFQEADYQVFTKTYRYRLQLEDYMPLITPETVGWRSLTTIAFNKDADAATECEKYCFANGEWLRAVAYNSNSGREMGYILIRIAVPDTEEYDGVYASAPNAGLMSMKIKEEYRRSGVATYLFGEVLRFIAGEYGVSRIESHISQDNAPLNALLKTLKWKIIDTGTVFCKEL
jgi:ribosomal protein S18 acetylase RimI-like enzyme